MDGLSFGRGRSFVRCAVHRQVKMLHQRVVGPVRSGLGNNWLAVSPVVEGFFTSDRNLTAHLLFECTEAGEGEKPHWRVLRTGVASGSQVQQRDGGSTWRKS
jgi:hypothetical protein